MKNITISLKIFTLIISVFISINAFSQTQTFTSDGIFVVPAGVYQVTVQAWGAGGGGSKITSIGRRGGGGGGGAYASSTITVTPAMSYSVVVGTGGTYSSAGGASSFDNTTVVAAGGSGGSNNSTNAGSGGTGSIGTITRTGGNGAAGGSTFSGGGGGAAGTIGNGGNAPNDNSGNSGISGGGSGGNGASGVSGSSDGNNGNTYGGGGSGAVTNSGTDRDGGSGANGYVIVSYTVVSGPEINIKGNATDIADGDTTPTSSDFTDFTSTAIGFPITRSFIIQNIGTNNINLTGTSPFVTISGANASDFSVTAIPSSIIAPSNSTMFTIQFNPSTVGTKNATLTVANNDADESSYDFSISGIALTPSPEINILSNATNIADGDTTPSTSDNTNFGSTVVALSITKTFTIQNLGTANLNLTSASPRIVISGANAADFLVTAIPSTPIGASGSTTFNIKFTPSAVGVRNAVLTIANNDSDEDPYNFNIQGTGTLGGTCVTTINTFPYTEDFETGIGAWIQDTGDNFDWTRRTGTTPTTNTGPFGAASGSYYMYTEADGNNSKTANFISPCFDLTGTVNPRFTFVHHSYGSNISSLSVQVSTDNGLTFPTTLFTGTGNVQKYTNSAWIPISIDLNAYIGQTIKLRIKGVTGSGNYSDIAIDNIRLTNKLSPIYAPGGVTADLSMWLKGNDGLSYTDGQGVALWLDQGTASDAKAHLAGQEPTFRDNATKNVNFNPVVEFDNPFGTFTVDDKYLYSDTSRKFLEGDFGLYTQEMFIVLIPDDTPINNSFGFMDVYCGDAHLETNAADATGIGFGDFTGRVSNEIICYSHDSYTTSESGDGYAVAEIGTGSSYNNMGIINARNNSANTQQELFYNARNIGNTQNDIAEYMNQSDSRFWLGRSEGWKASLNARVAEVISYKVRKTDATMSHERNRIQSYLGIKYGITLGVNGTSQDYVNSNGSVIWNQIANLGYNYNIAGIGRDDKSELNQKQSKSVNDDSDGSGPIEGILTIGLSNIYDTNNLNTNAFPLDKQFLVWGDNGANLNTPAATVTVNMSAGISPSLTTDVSFVAMQRVWKVVENGGDIPSCKVRIPQNAIRNINPPGSYLMFISDTGVFDPTADYRVMTLDVNGNLSADYDFDGTKYITFGYAPQVIVERSVYFDGAQDYIDMENNLNLNTSEYTISVWIKRDAGAINGSILSKRNATYTEGYDFRINATGRLEFVVNGGAASVTSSVVIPENKWHEVAVIYSGGTATLYIDGVPDTSATLPAPTATNQSFYIAAAGKNAPTAYFKGNIDEVRIWNRALTVDQLRYIMNQEIIDNSTLALKRGDVIPTTITKNELNTIPWTDLAGYYPLSVYTYTNTNDMSGNNHQGALRNLDTVDRQTAPLPYVSQADGAWSTAATWLNNTVQELPNALSIIDGTTPIGWNIVELNNNITIDDFTTLGRERSVQGLIQKSGDLQVNGNTASNTGNGLTVTHYLKLDGTIDLEGESQLIQTDGSDLDATSAGSLERDQQGYSNTYRYNYWSSPVAPTINSSYKVPQVITNVGFLTSGYNGTITPSVKNADYWIWKYANLASNSYSLWQHTRSTGDISTGEGFTMKGPEGTAITDQNYIFKGKPNNGNITALSVLAGNDYLIGNPYPSAMDAEKFIKDNISIADGGNNASGNVINGALYFWDHFAVNSHNLGDYEGGYAIYNLTGGTEAISNDARIKASGVYGTKVPERYIPVSQGFFVSAVSDPSAATLSQPIAGGIIQFKNSQRVFKKEIVTGPANTGSQFFKSSSKSKTADKESVSDVDVRQKIRLMFDSPSGYHRQLLVGADENASNDFNLGYDALLNEANKEDMYWQFSGSKFIIQAVNNFNNDQVLPLGIKVTKAGLATIRIQELNNMDANANVFVHDKQLNTYHNLKDSNYQVYLTAGSYADRFEITFANGQALSTDTVENNALQVYFSNENESIIVHNPNALQLKSVEVLNILGQSVLKFESDTKEKYITHKTKNMATGAYIIKLNTTTGVISKKVLVQ